MKLLKLTLNNFKGIRNFEISPDGKSITIYGDNGTGKTTLADAQYWLLFGVDSACTKNFIPKPKTESDYAHGLETSVEGAYQLENGCTITLKRTFSEVWKKKRGSAEAVFSGHKKEHFIDSVPVKESEYIERITAIAALEILSTLCSATYFSDVLSPDKRRKTLLEVTGDISDSDVISSTPFLCELTELLEKEDGSKRSTEELLKLSKSRLAEINRNLQIIPARIDEAEKAIPDIEQRGFEKELKALGSKKNDILKRMAADDNAILAESQEALAAVQIELLDAEKNYKSQWAEANKETEKQLKDLMCKKQIAVNTRLKADMNVIKFKQELEELNRKRQVILDKHKSECNAKWNGNTICPICGQAIPKDQIEESKRNFLIEKSCKLEALVKLGRETCSKEMVEELKNKLARDEKDSEEQSKKIDNLTQKIEKLNSNLIQLKPFSETEEYRKLQKKRESAATAMHDINQQKNIANDLLKCELDEIENSIDAILKQKAAAEQAEIQKKRILELESEMQHLNCEYEHQSKAIALCEEFIRAKVSMLTDNINEKFGNVKFKLFETQINGGIKEVCETLVPCSTGLIPYAYANHASKINAGLDIIRVLSKHYGVHMPVFVDNAESIVNICDSGLQVIRLVVSENDKNLRVEEN